MACDLGSSEVCAEQFMLRSRYVQNAWIYNTESDGIVHTIQQSFDAIISCQTNITKEKKKKTEKQANPEPNCGFNDSLIMPRKNAT